MPRQSPSSAPSLARTTNSSSPSHEQKQASSELAEFQEIFSLVDRDQGGTISKVELADLMDVLGIETSPEEIDAMIKETDRSGNGDIGFEEFVALMSRKVITSHTPDEVKNAFRALNLHNDASAKQGFIDVDSLAESLETFSNGRGTKEEASELIAQLEPDRNRRINFIENVNLMM
eukprot:CAMPEP_0194372388 /NCGR_PEP_ID=MMETSP0174-20130528/20740_1 /TAXON_ID=216777 /ORGANISM="Proboscia alata, Strain PI-D3" /LENGTH=175 /DNA_ID=CAMNT_0039150889 /DNA_START=90 /DNA_END=614 /DNA_ORIENTATION=+